MQSYERAFIDEVIQNLAASIASHLREGLDAESFFVDDEGLTDEGLTDEGWMFVYGYVTSRLTVLRASTTSNPNLTVEDMEEVRSCIDEHEANIAAELYA